MADEFKSAFPPLREELERIRVYERAVVEQLAFVDRNSERLAQEAQEDESLLFGMNFEEPTDD